MSKDDKLFFKEYFLPDSKQLIIQNVNLTDATEILKYLETVGHETDYLSFGPGELKLTLQEEEDFIQTMNGKATNIMLKGLINNKIVSLLTIKSGNFAKQYFTCDLGISVLKAYWGNNIGYLMMQAGIKIAKSRGVAKINLIVRSDNIAAINLYQKLNFKKEGKLSKDIYINNTFYNSLLFGLDLEKVYETELKGLNAG